MYEKILELLRAKFEGVPESILQKVAKKQESKAKTEEEANTLVEGITIQSIIESYGDSRATEAQQTAVTNYEKKYGLKDGEKVEKTKEPEPNPPAEVPEWAKSLTEAVTQLTQKVTSMETEKVTDTRKGRLTSAIEKLPENLRKGYSRISVDNMDEESFNTLIGEIEQEVEELGKSYGKPGGTNVSTPPVYNIKPGDSASKDEVDAVLSHMNI